MIITTIITGLTPASPHSSAEVLDKLRQSPLLSCRPPAEHKYYAEHLQDCLWHMDLSLNTTLGYMVL